MVLNSLAQYNTAHGIYAIKSIVRDCISSQNSSTGIYCYGECFIENNIARNNHAGIVLHDNCAIARNNNVIKNNVGISTLETNNFIIQNYASQNATNYLLHTSSTAGQIADVQGQEFSETNAWANFEY